MRSRSAAHVLKAYQSILKMDSSKCPEFGKSIPIPVFDEETLLDLCEEVRKLNQRKEMVIELRAPYYVVGDIHGNIFDLVRILVHSQAPPLSRLLFLGDYVDRGEYSIEVITLLFALQVAYPDHMVLLRGNHEFEMMNSTYGFQTEVQSQYGSRRLYDTFNDVFQYLPLVAIINNQIFCVHGGISPHLNNIQQIYRIRRPLPAYDVEFVADFVWSDPCYECKTYDESNRGLGVQFGPKALADFLNGIHMKCMIRAHQCVQNGIAKFGQNLLYTVFSCSNYADSHGNKCGLIFIEMNLNIKLFSLPPMDQLPRATANLVRIGSVPVDEMDANESLALNVKLFDIKKSNASKIGFPNRSKENLLQKFSNSNVNVNSQSLLEKSRRTRQIVEPLPNNRVQPLIRSASAEKPHPIDVAKNSFVNRI